MKAGKIISYVGVALFGFCASQTYDSLQKHQNNSWQAERTLENKKIVFKAEGMSGLHKAESLIEASSKDVLDKEGRTFIIWEEMGDTYKYRQGLEDGKQMLRDSLKGKGPTIIKAPINMPNFLGPKIEKGFSIII